MRNFWRLFKKMKKRILVTGGAGFIGSNFCNANAEKYEIIALDNLLLGDFDNLKKNVQKIKGDAADPKVLEKIGAVDFILHFAGSSSAPMFVKKFAASFENSISSFVRVLEFAKKVGAKKVLYASTSSLYGNNPLPLTENQIVTPQNFYAVSKDFYENCARTFCAVEKEIDVVGFRFMSVYGPNEEAKGEFANIISQFAWDFARGKAPVIFGDGEQFRDFTHVSDIVAALTAALETDQKLGAAIFNLGTGKGTTLNEIVAALKKAFKSDISPIYIKNPVKEVYIHGQCADISKAKKVLKWSPKMPLEKGILDQVQNLRKEKIRKTSSDDFRKEI